MKKRVYGKGSNKHRMRLPWMAKGKETWLAMTRSEYRLLSKARPPLSLLKTAVFKQWATWKLDHDESDCVTLRSRKRERKMEREEWADAGRTKAWVVQT